MRKAIKKDQATAWFTPKVKLTCDHNDFSYFAKKRTSNAIQGIRGWKQCYSTLATLFVLFYFFNIVFFLFNFILLIFSHFYNANKDNKKQISIFRLGTHEIGTDFPLTLKINTHPSHPHLTNFILNFISLDSTYTFLIGGRIIICIQSQGSLYGYAKLFSNSVELPYRKTIRVV